MSQPSPFGPPVEDDPTGDAPVVATTDGPPEKKTRVGLLAVAGTGVVAGAALLGFLLMSGTSEDLEGQGAVARAPRATTTASPSTSPTPLPTESTVNARNPFLSPPSPSASGSVGNGDSGSTSGNQTTQTPASGSPATSAPATPTASPTPAVEPVLVWLVGMNKTTYEAKFTVMSPAETGKSSWTVPPGEPFGKPLTTRSAKPFTYAGVVALPSGELCVSVQFVDALPVQVCKGAPVQVQ